MIFRQRWGLAFVLIYRGLNSTFWEILKVLEDCVSHRRRALLAVGLAVSLAGTGFGVETKVIRDETFSDFNQGESTGTELMAQGRLKIAPRAERLDKTDEGVAWRVASGRTSRE